MSRALALTVTLAATPAAAEPEPLVDRKNHYQLDLAAGWKVQRSGEPPELLTLRHRSDEARATLTRTNFPNGAAWRGRDHYVDDVVAGLKAATPGFALLRRRRGKLGRVPYLDVSYRRSHEQLPRVQARFLFYRTFTLILTAPSTRAGRRHAARLVRSFSPP